MAKKRECMCDDDRGGDTELIDTSDSAVLHIKLNTCQLWYILPLILTQFYKHAINWTKGSTVSYNLLHFHKINQPKYVVHWTVYAALFLYHQLSFY